MFRLSFRQRLWMPLVLGMLALVILSVANAFQVRSVRLHERESALRQDVEVARAAVDAVYQQVKTNQIDEAEAQRRAKDVIRTLHYGENGYFSAVDDKLIIVANGASRKVENSDGSTIHDPDGVYLWRAAAQVAQAQGIGFVHYRWPRPGQNEPLPKLSVAAQFEPWHWTLITGVYIDDLDAAFRQSLWTSLGVLVLIAACLSSVVFFINRSLLRSLGGDPRYAASVAAMIADNDLSGTVNVDAGADDSLLASIRTMKSQLTHSMSQVKQSAQSIAVATREIAAGNQDLSQRTEEQAAALQESVASIGELMGTVARNVEHTRQAETIAVEAARIAQEGNVAFDEVVGTMTAISTSSEQMRHFVGMIEGISFQTNILALNAAVEAARAGDSGRGFAVVASEVRTLAQRSASASKEIRELIETSGARVGDANKRVASAGTTMNQLSAAIARVNQIVADISFASDEQAKGLAQVNVAIAQMDEVTQQNAALVEQAAAAAASLSAQTDDLQAVTTPFRF
ncbi:methyl-accepting chemotaxis protein [Robbsia sp. KACC 23696]|uniref:methyl-accepting chemotaxis protein n=1 Tax=Robbsia sp. KACC 23696 TaxID=3149231 RepID=UPI00325B313E